MGAEHRAWQRQLNAQAISAADRIGFIQPLSREKPSLLQPKAEKSQKRDEMAR